MTSEPITVGPISQSTLLELSAKTGRSAVELLDAAVELYRRALGQGLSVIPGVDPKDVWEAHAQADAGRLETHESLFGKLRSGR